MGIPVEVGYFVNSRLYGLNSLTIRIHSVPASILALVILILAIPASFPHGRSSVHRSMKNVFSKEAARRLDFLGFLFLLSASVLTITGFQEAATRLTWRNSSTIALLTVSGLLWIGFFLWSRFLSREGHTQEPVFTWRFAQNREFIGVLLYAQSVLQSLLKGTLTFLNLGLRSLWAFHLRSPS